VDGYEVCRRLRADPATAGIPILMFTAKSSATDKVAGFEAGADDYLTKPVRPADLISRLEAVLLRSVQKRARESLPVRAKLIGFIGSKGGVGTTTLAVNVAAALAQEVARDKQVILADLAPGLGGIALQMSLHPGLVDKLLSMQVSGIDPATVVTCLQEHKSNVRVLTGQSEPLGLAAPIPRAQAEAIVRGLGASGDYVLLDLGCGLAEPNPQLLTICHQVIMVIEPQRMALTMAQAVLGEMTRALQMPKHKIGLVLINKAASGATFTRDNLEEQLQHELVGIVTPAPDLAFQSGERGIPMVMLQPDSLVARQYRNIAEYLVTLSV